MKTMLEEGPMDAPDDDMKLRVDGRDVLAESFDDWCHCVYHPIAQFCPSTSVFERG